MIKNNINVSLQHRSYPIIVEKGLINRIPELLSEFEHGQKWVLLAQPVVMELYGDKLQLNLQNSGFNCSSIIIPATEEAKSLTEFQSVISKLVEENCDRSTTILAVGGGVTGDLSGYVASSFMRGIDYFQIPTTLLSMVDSAIGGKTGINIKEGKNLIGAIYQPKGVFIDPEFLESLPNEEIISGLGEVIKYGAIRDKQFLQDISQWLNNIETFPFDLAISKACSIKAEIVSKDEIEGDIRRILNFGHTVGHALEGLLGYGKIRHGEAVAYGMLCAGYISNKLGLLSSEEFSILSSVIKKLQLPDLPELNGDQLLPYIKNDKKVSSGVLNFVVLDGLGIADISKEVSEDMILESLIVLRKN